MRRDTSQEAGRTRHRNPHHDENGQEFRPRGQQGEQTGDDSHRNHQAADRESEADPTPLHRLRHFHLLSTRFGLGRGVLVTTLYWSLPSVILIA